MARRFLDAVTKPTGRVTRGNVERYLCGLLKAGKSISTRNTRWRRFDFCCSRPRGGK
ncbi:MAG: hypothetical protein R3B13_26745 [Polyangiaceae bacterium]